MYLKHFHVILIFRSCGITISILFVNYSFIALLAEKNITVKLLSNVKKLTSRAFLTILAIIMLRNLPVILILKYNFVQERPLSFY